MTKRQSYEQTIRKVKATNPAWAARLEAELVLIEPPAAVLHLLMKFYTFNSKRTYQVVASMDTAIRLPEALCPLKQEAQCRQRGWQLTPWEAETIDLCDEAFLEESAKLRG